MKKVSEIQKEINEINENATSRIDEANKYMEFSKAYNKKHDVTGPFDAKFKGKKKEQKKYMEDLGKAWGEHKKKSGIVSKKTEKK